MGVALVEDEQMSIEQWDAGHRAVFEAYKKQLPSGDELESLSYSLRRDDKREAAYDGYQAGVLAELGDKADDLLVAYLGRPAEHRLTRLAEEESFLTNRIASILAGVHCERHPSAASAQALMARLQMMFDDPKGACDNKSLYDNPNDYSEQYLFPEARHCIRMLNAHFAQEGVEAFLLATYRGDFNQRSMLFEDDDDDDTVVDDSCVRFIGGENASFDGFLQHLFAKDELDADWFQQAMRLFPNLVIVHRLFPDDDDGPENEGVDARFLSIYREMLVRQLKAGIARLPVDAPQLETLLRYGGGIRGIEWQQLGLQTLERLGLKARDLKKDYEEIPIILQRLLGLKSLAEGEIDEDLLAMLRGFNETVLLLALPYAGYARNAILQALGWEVLLPLQKQLFSIAGSHAAASVDSLDDVYNTTDADSGVIDRQSVVEAGEGVDPKILMKYVRALRASSLEIGNALLLLLAALGLERDKLEKKLVRHGQTAIKAYGLLPLADEKELRERYLHFKQMHKDAKQYGSERQANTQAAVAAGLKNLAGAAGYSDEVRLEWAMEAGIATDMIAMNQVFDAEDWTLKLTLEGISPRIQISKDGKRLKSVPARVRKTGVYAQMREAQEQIRAQASRFRNTLEDMMCSGERFSPDELATLTRLPVVNAMLSQLVMKTEDGRFGLFDGAENALRDVQGESLPISGAVSIAHVWHLFDAGVLADWQQAVVAGRLVQPFKQAFRELYVLTPAEQQAGTHSRRFVGHVVDAAVTSRLLQARGWSQSGGDDVQVYKRFPAQGLFAEIGFPDARHYLAGEETLTIDEVWFSGKGGDIPLAEVEPILFSEVMRDVDLIASVAQVGDDDERWSTETAQRRAELIASLVRDIGLQQVRCEDHFAHVDGKLASYRIHLGSGVIHIQPGNYLCIVPAETKDEGLYLPFADTDRRMAEIVSKIFMLVSDDQIKDETILEQIQQADSGEH